jgi:hypothetical protein
MSSSSKRSKDFVRGMTSMGGKWEAEERNQQEILQKRFQLQHCCAGGCEVDCPHYTCRSGLELRLLLLRSRASEGGGLTSF